LLLEGGNYMAENEEMLFSETDGSCAYCGIKDYRVLTIHHIIQQEPKDESYDNKIVLCHNCHHLYHQGKGPTKDDLVAIKRRLIYKTLTQQGVNVISTGRVRSLILALLFMLRVIDTCGRPLRIKYDGQVMASTDELT
jgi:hypothetical protein